MRAIEPSDIASPRTDNPALIGYASPSKGSVSDTRMFFENSVEDVEVELPFGNPQESKNKSRTNKLNNLLLDNLEEALSIFMLLEQSHTLIDLL